MKKQDNPIITIQHISKKIQEIKITSFYLLSTDLYKLKNDKLINNITKKYDKHPATLMVLKNANSGELFCKQNDLWKLPPELQNLQKEVETKTSNYLELYFKKLESKKLNYTLGSNGNLFVKYVFMPIVEGTKEDLYFYFITLTVYQNGSIVIDLFEDLRNAVYADDFFTAYTFMKFKLFPNFNDKEGRYVLNSDKQIDDILKNIKSGISSIGGGINFNEQVFFQHFITNMDDMNKENFFKKNKLYSWMVNAPYLPHQINRASVRDSNSKNFITIFFDLNYIKYINKGVNYIVWDKTDGEVNFETSFLNQASYFLAAAIPFFQSIALNETIMDGIEKFKLSDDRLLIRFNEWVHNYKKSFLYIYRLPFIPITELYIHLQENSNFKHNDFIESIKLEEMELIKEKNQFNNTKRELLIETILFIISALSLLQVIDIFTDDIHILQYAGISLFVLSVILFIIRKKL